jgi:hypothetical protein
MRATLFTSRFSIKTLYRYIDNFFISEIICSESEINRLPKIEISNGLDHTLIASLHYQIWRDASFIDEIFYSKNNSSPVIYNQ